MLDFGQADFAPINSTKASLYESLVLNPSISLPHAQAFPPFCTLDIRHKTLRVQTGLAPFLIPPSCIIVQLQQGKHISQSAILINKCFSAFTIARPAGNQSLCNCAHNLIKQPISLSQHNTSTHQQCLPLMKIRQQSTP